MASQCRVRRWPSSRPASARMKLPVSMAPRVTPSLSSRRSQCSSAGVVNFRGSKPATTSSVAPFLSGSSAASALTDMPLLASTAPPSALSTCQRYSSPRKRLATRNGSMAEINPMAEKPGINKK
ncbi:hypothetical protein D3C86_1517500 [compost metagenome]